MTVLTGVISYPISAYQNVPIAPQNFLPSQFVISGVTLGWTTTITTTENMNYVVGQEVRLLIPSVYGCFQLNNAQGFVLSIPSANQVVVSINSSRNVDQFISASLTNSPQIIAIGDIQNGSTNANGSYFSGTYIPGAFINVSS